jgi:hypothetical protein
MGEGGGSVGVLCMPEVEGVSLCLALTTHTKICSSGQWVSGATCPRVR